MSEEKRLGWLSPREDKVDSCRDIAGRGCAEWLACQCKPVLLNPKALPGHLSAHILRETPRQPESDSSATLICWVAHDTAKKYGAPLVTFFARRSQAERVRGPERPDSHFASIKSMRDGYSVVRGWRLSLSRRMDVGLRRGNLVIFGCSRPGRHSCTNQEAGGTEGPWKPDRAHGPT